MAVYVTKKLPSLQDFVPSTIKTFPETDLLDDILSRTANATGDYRCKQTV